MDRIKYFIFNNLLIIIISTFLILSLIFNIYLYFNKEVEVINKECNSINEIDNMVYVEVKGEVKNKGVYKVKEGSIINDIIDISGGFTKNAYTKNINLSKKIVDEMVIYVYSKSEYNKQKEIVCNKEINNNDDNVSNNINEYIKEYDISNNIDNKESVITDVNNEIIKSNDSNIVNKNTNNKININRASKEEIMTLKGFGEKKAQSVIDYRTINGLFKNIEDIKNVDGIGETTYNEIKEFIEV